MLQKLSNQPESYRELLARSFNLYRYALRQVLMLGLLLSAVIFMPRLIADVKGEDLSALVEPQTAYNIIASVLLYITGIGLMAAIFWHVYCVAKRRKDSFSKDFQVALSKLFYIIIAAIVLFIIGSSLSFINYYIGSLLQQTGLFYQPDIWPTLLLLTIIALQMAGSLYISTLFYFYLPLIVTENDKPIFSLVDSAKLVWGNVWRVISLQLTPWIVYLLTIIIIKLVFKVNFHIYVFQNDGASTLYESIFHLIIFALFIPWFIATGIAQLHDLELRKKLKKK
jgi:hypothetical protein